jgi:hypothetical protein
LYKSFADEPAAVKYDGAANYTQIGARVQERECVRCACVSFACCCCAPLDPIVTTDFQLHAHQDSLALSLNDFADLEVVLPLQWNQ